MARMPGVTYRGDGAFNGNMVRYDFLVGHTAVSPSPAPAAHFSVMWNGVAIQHRDTAHQSAACLNGNPTCIAIEVMDKGTGFPAWSGDNVPPMREEQIETCAHIAAWCHVVHGIPLWFTMNSRPGSQGVSVHRAGIDGNFAGYAFPGRISGGVLWSQYFGKVCPTDSRIFQWRDRVIPRAIQIIEGEERMDTADIEQLMNYSIPRAGDGQTGSTSLRGVLAYTDSAWAQMRRVEAKLDGLTGTLAGDEAAIIAAVRDPNNPATTDLINRILGGVTTIVEAHDDPDLTLDPDQMLALANSILGAMRPEMRDTVAAGLRDVFSDLADGETTS